MPRVSVDPVRGSPTTKRCCGDGAAPAVLFTVPDHQEALALAIPRPLLRTVITAGFSLLFGGAMASLALTAAIDAGFSAYSVGAVTYVAWVVPALAVAAALTVAWRHVERRRAARLPVEPEPAAAPVAGTEASGPADS